MNISIERKKPDVSALQRDKVDVYYISPAGAPSTAGKKIEGPSPRVTPVRHGIPSSGDVMDLSPGISEVPTTSARLLTSNSSLSQSLIQRSLSVKRKLPENLPSPGHSRPSFPDYSRGGMRTDISLVPPIRQTASIFKQPVTVYKTQESKVKSELKHGVQERPKQLFWEKRLEALHACDVDGHEFTVIELNKGLRPVGPNVNETTLLQSIATSLHVSNHSVTGQTASRSALAANPGVFLNADQPLMYSYNINEEDIRRQEDRVQSARKKLQEALKN
ncbi:methyl-CpG-binding domain protein 2 [Sergentomyia squamirostris]